jgi:hypothetical protein
MHLQFYKKKLDLLVDLIIYNRATITQKRICKVGVRQQLILSGWYLSNTYND